MQIIGYKRCDFKTADGKLITGYNFYLGYQLHGDDADGMATLQKVYFSDQKLDKCGYTPCVGDIVEITYNNFKKPLVIQLIERK